MKSCKYFHFLSFIALLLFPLALKAGTGELEKALKSSRDTAQVNALNKLSWEYRRENPGKAMLYGLRAQALSEKLDYRAGKAMALKNRGVIHWIKGEYPQAEAKYKIALQLFRQEENQEETGNMHNLFGLLYWNQGKYPQAVAAYNEALKVFTAIGDIDGKAYVYNNLGIIYYELNNFDLAIGKYTEAVKIYEQQNDRFALSNVYNNIGLIFSDQGNYLQALKYYRASLNIDRESRNFAGQGKSYTNIGSAYFRLGDLEQSEANHRKAMDIFRQIGDKHGMAESLINLGEIDFRRKAFAGAEAQWNEALSIKREIGEVKGECMALLHLGRFFMAQGKDTEAIQALTQAFEIAENTGSLKYQQEAASCLSGIFEKKGQTLKALQYYKTWVSIADSIRAQQAANRLLDLQIAFETKQKQQQVELWKKEFVIQRGKKQALAVGIIFILLIAAILISRQRLKHRKEKKIAELLIGMQCASQRSLELEMKNMELEIEFNRKSLMAYTQKLIEKNAVVESLMQQVSENTAQSVDEREANIARLMETRIVTEDDWIEFKKLFTAVYPAFMLQLQEKYPAITQAELRLSALIALKLSTREIASVLGISSDSVKKSRQRLRKKMNLTIEEDLDGHILTAL